jgi:hypothetical protein
VHVVQLVILDEQSVAANVSAMANQHTFRATFGNFDVSSKAVRVVQMPSTVVCHRRPGKVLPGLCSLNAMFRPFC